MVDSCHDLLSEWNREEGVGRPKMLGSTTVPIQRLRTNQQKGGQIASEKIQYDYVHCTEGPINVILLQPS